MMWVGYARAAECLQRAYRSHLTLCGTTDIVDYQETGMEIMRCQRPVSWRNKVCPACGHPPGSSLFEGIRFPGGMRFVP